MVSILSEIHQPLGVVLLNRLTVIVPVYNAEKVLHRSLDTLIAQTDQRFSVILVDDGSTDRSAEICDQYCTNQENWTCIHQQNRGLSGARNAGLMAVQTEYVLFMDADDSVEPELVQTIETTFQRITPQLLVFGYYYDQPQKDHLISRVHAEGFSYYTEPAQMIRAAIRMKQNAVIDPVWNKVFAMDVIRTNALQMPEGELYEDTDFVFRYLAKSADLLVLGKPLYHYIQHDGNRITNAWHPEKYETLKKRVLTMCAVVNQMSDERQTMDQAAFWMVRYTFSVLIDVLGLDQDTRNYWMQLILSDREAHELVRGIGRLPLLTDRILLRIYRSHQRWLIVFTAQLMRFVKYRLKTVFVRIR